MLRAKVDLEVWRRVEDHGQIKQQAQARGGGGVDKENLL